MLHGRLHGRGPAHRPVRGGPATRATGGRVSWRGAQGPPGTCRCSLALAKTGAVLDEPIADPAAMNACLIAQSAREDGTVVLLSGQGADEIFGGYRRHVAGRLLGAMDWLPSVARRALVGAGGAIPGARPGRMGALLRRIRKLLEAARGDADEPLLQLCAVAPAPGVEERPGARGSRRPRRARPACE